MSTKRLGFDALDDNEFANPSGDGGGGGDGRPFDFFIGINAKAGQKDATKRVIFLDEDPAMVWEHDLYSVSRKVGERVVCLKKNQIADRCPLCDLANDDAVKAMKDKNGKQRFAIWPKLNGYLTVIDCGDVIKDKAGNVKLVPYAKGDKRYIFNRKLLRAGKGWEKKPGMIFYLRRKKEQYGNRLTGLVFDAYRGGEAVEAIGGEYSAVEDSKGNRVKFDFLLDVDYSDEHAVEEATNLLKQALVDMEGSPAQDVNDPLLKYVNIVPTDYDEHVYKSLSIPEMDKLAARLRAQIGLPSDGSGYVPPSDAGGGDYGADEDVPF